MARRAPARNDGKPLDDEPNTTGEGTWADAGGDEGDSADADTLAARDEAVEELTERLVPERVAADLKLGDNQQARALLAELCYVFGLNPDPKVKPREVVAHKFDAGDPDATPPVPPTVTVVTGGGLKIRYPLDEDTENRLRIVFNAYTVEKGTGARVTLPLPPDMTLPRASVDGLVHSGEHVYRTGYLREGGAAESARRAKLRQLGRG